MLSKNRLNKIFDRTRASLFTLAIGFLLLEILAGGSCRADDEVNLYFKALDLFVQENYSEGVKKYYKFVLTADPLISLSCRRMDLTKPYQYYAKKLEENPDDKKASLFLSLIDRITLQWESADGKLNQLQEKVPQSVLLVFLKGEYLLARRMEEEARQTFAFLEKNPLAKKFYFLSQYLLERGGVAAGIKPETRRKALMAMGYRQMDLMEWDQSEELLKQVLKEFPDDPEAPRALAQMFLEKKRYPELDALMEDWKKKHEKSLIPPEKEAEMRYLQEDFERVLKLLSGINVDESGREALRLMIAESLFNLEEYDKALLHFKILFARDSQDPGLFHRVISCYEQTGKEEEPLKEFETYLENNPKDPLMRLEYVGWLERLNKMDKAEEELKKITGVESPYKEYIEEKLNDLREARLKKQEVQTKANEPKLTVSPEPLAVQTGGIISAPSLRAGSKVGKSVLGSKSRQELELLKKMYSK